MNTYPPEAVVLRRASVGAGLPLAETENAVATFAVAPNETPLTKAGATGVSVQAGILSAGSPSRFRPNCTQRSASLLEHRLTMSALCIANAVPSVRPLVSYIRL